MSDIIASARSMTVVSDGQYNTIGLPKASLTPSTLTAMVGMSRGWGNGLDVNPNVTTSINSLANVYLTNPGLGTAANSAASSLSTLNTKLMAGGPAAFMQKFNAARAHIADANEIDVTTTFIGSSKFENFGSGIKDMNSLATRGLDNSIGDLSQAGALMEKAGGMYDLKDMSSFGTNAGFIEKLKSSKLANSTGVTEALTKAGVDVNDLSNPAYQDSIRKAMSGITDPKAIKDVSEQFDVNPFAGLPAYQGTDSSLQTNAASNLLGGSSGGGSSSLNVTGASTAFGAPSSGTRSTSGYSSAPTSFGANQIEGQEGTGVAGLKGTPFDPGTFKTDWLTGKLGSVGAAATTAIGADIAPSTTHGGTGIQNLGEFTDMKKLVDPNQLSGLQTDLSGMGSKFKDLGAKFKDSAAAKDMLTNIQQPGATNFTGAYSSLNGLMGEFGSDFNSITGKGLTGELPKVTDFTMAVSGGPEIDAIAGGTVDSTTIAALQAKINNSNSLFATAGIDIDTPPTVGLGTLMSAATSLHKIGADGSGAAAMAPLQNMRTNDVFGDSIKVALAEGKNNKLMAANGISPPVYNPFEGLPSSSENNSSADAARLLGGS